jgi:predicted Zn-ribbon and HTH transcriptional regulator
MGIQTINGNMDLLKIYTDVDTYSLQFKNPTNCFQTTRAYLTQLVPYTFNAAKFISNPREFGCNKDVYHVEVFDKKTRGHSFLFVRSGPDIYKLVQSFQNKYALRVEPETYSYSDVNSILKKFASFKTFSKDALETVRSVTKNPDFNFNLCLDTGDECRECGYAFKKTRLHVVINEYDVTPHRIQSVIRDCMKSFKQTLMIFVE